MAQPSIRLSVKRPYGRLCDRKFKLAYTRTQVNLRSTFTICHEQKTGCQARNWIATAFKPWQFMQYGMIVWTKKLVRRTAIELQRLSNRSNSCNLEWLPERKNWPVGQHLNCHGFQTVAIHAIWNDCLNEKTGPQDSIWIATAFKPCGSWKKAETEAKAEGWGRGHLTLLLSYSLTNASGVCESGIWRLFWESGIWRLKWGLATPIAFPSALCYIWTQVVTPKKTNHRGFALSVSTIIFLWKSNWAEPSCKNPWVIACFGNRHSSFIYK